MSTAARELPFITITGWLPKLAPSWAAVRMPWRVKKIRPRSTAAESSTKIKVAARANSTSAWPGVRFARLRRNIVLPSYNDGYRSQGLRVQGPPVIDIGSASDSARLVRVHPEVLNRAALGDRHHDPALA